jgi:hypothetical protein
VPALLNGGLDKISPEFWGACLGMSAAIDLYGVQKARSGDPSYFPGNLGYVSRVGCNEKEERKKASTHQMPLLEMQQDPLNLYPRSQVEQKQMQLAEIKHGRLAMVAVVGYASQESISEIGVVDETPFFFFPFTESAVQFLQTIAN